MHRPNILAHVGKWSFISELANIYTKENTRRCPLCVELLFLSLKMKLWHITKTSLDFAKVPSVHSVEQPSCSGSSQHLRSAEAPWAAAAAPAGSAHPTAPRTPDSCLGGRQPELWAAGGITLLPGLLGPRWELRVEKANQFNLYSLPFFSHFHL